MITPDRLTRVFFDADNGPEILDAGFSIQRVGSEIFQNAGKLPGIEFKNGGWMLKSTLSRLLKTVDASPQHAPKHIIKAGDYSVPESLFQEKNISADIPNSELSNITNGSEKSYLPFLVKLINPNADFNNQKLPPPPPVRSSRPPLSISDFILDAVPRRPPIDNVFITKFLVNERESFAFLAIVHGSFKNAKGVLFRIFFPGPRTILEPATKIDGPEEIGSGLFCLELTHREELRLYEYSFELGDYKMIRSINVHSYSRHSSDGMIYLGVSVIKTYKDDEPPACSIYSLYGDYDPGMNLPTTGLDSSIITGIRPSAVPNNQVIEWTGTKKNPSQPPYTDTVLSIDMRRDLFGGFQLYYHGYNNTIEAFDAVQGVRITGRNSSNLWLVWDFYSDLYPNAYIDAYLLDENKTPLSELKRETTNSGNRYQCKKIYAYPKNIRNFYVKFVFVGSDRHSPLLASYIIQQPALHAPSSVVEKELLPPARLSSISTTGQTADISEYSANIEFHDLGRQYEQFNSRSSIRTRIEIDVDEYDELTNTTVQKKCVLFRGYAQKTTSTIRGKSDQSIVGNFPAPLWPTRRVSLVGPWMRLKQQFVKEFFITVSAAGPQYVVDVLKFLFSNTGFECDLPTPRQLPVKITPMSEESYIAIKPGANMYDLITGIVKLYTGCYLVWDDNAGTHGRFKLLFPPRPPYIPKARFVISNNWTEPKLEMYLPSYGKTNGIPNVPVFAGSMSFYVKPPEANKITVGYVTRMASESRYTQIVLVNPKSYNFDPFNPTADPNHPDYLGYELPMWVNEPVLASAIKDRSKFAIYDPVMFAYAKRIYDLAAHSVAMMTFEAPLVLIPHEDNPNRLRPLRYYDPVEVEGIPYLVRSVNVAYTKDRVQKAIYELELPRI